MSQLNVGGHLSLGRNPKATVEWAAHNGFESMQIFASSPGAWKLPVVNETRAADFVQARQEFGIEPLFIHAIYLINLASANPDLVRQSRVSLAATLRAGAALGATGVVTHIGSHAGLGFNHVAPQIVEGLHEVLDGMPEEIDLILENSAGAGAIVGAEIAELGQLLAGTGNRPHLNVALDTAHLCGSGWDFTEPDAAARLVEEVERDIGLERLVLIHANDSKVPPGSRKDRHANIGEGYIGMVGFAHLLAEPALRGIPWVLETPDLDQRVDDLTKLRGIADNFGASESMSQP